MAAKPTPLKHNTTVKEGGADLEKIFFTVSVYARGLRGQSPQETEKKSFS